MHCGIHEMDLLVFVSMFGTLIAAFTAHLWLIPNSNGPLLGKLDEKNVQKDLYNVKWFLFLFIYFDDIYLCITY